MNINYLFSIITLYLNKEENKKTNLRVIKQINNKILFKFNMNKDDNDFTSFSLPYEIVMNESNLNDFIKMYKQDLIIIDEKYEYDKTSETCYYYALLNNGRVLSFKDFSIEEVNNIRNAIYDIKIQKDEIRIVIEKEEKEKGKYFRLQEAGFANYLTIFLITVWILNIFMLSLWFFKGFINK